MVSVFVVLLLFFVVFLSCCRCYVIDMGMWDHDLLQQTQTHLFRILIQDNCLDLAVSLMNGLGPVDPAALKTKTAVSNILIEVWHHIWVPRSETVFI